jgi:hypothetical protein
VSEPSVLSACPLLGAAAEHAPQAD